MVLVYMLTFIGGIFLRDPWSTIYKAAPKTDPYPGPWLGRSGAQKMVPDTLFGSKVPRRYEAWNPPVESRFPSMGFNGGNVTPKWMVYFMGNPSINGNGGNPICSMYGIFTYKTGSFWW